MRQKQKSLVQIISSDPRLIENELMALEVETVVSQRLSNSLSDEDLIQLTKLLRSESKPEEIKIFLKTACPEIERILEEEIKKVKEKYQP